MMHISTKSSLAVTGLALALILPMSIGTAQARDWKDIKSSGVLKVANSGAYPPFSFVDKQGNLIGFDVDIADAVAKKMGLKAEVKSTPWSGIVAALVADKFEVCICSMSVTEERKKAVDFTEAYYRSGNTIFVKSDSSIKSIDDMKGKVIGSVLGETANEWAVKHGGWTNQTYQGLPDLLMAINTDRVDAIITDDVPVLLAIKDKAYKIKSLNVQGFTRSDNAFTIRQNQPDLKAGLQKALNEIKADGTYAKIAEKWIGTDISK